MNVFTGTTGREMKGLTPANIYLAARHAQQHRHLFAVISRENFAMRWPHSLQGS